ncbi:MAG: biotin--[acetyl-CoA-carboxylase] ligase, partial [Myxococcota bacterium]|nr:biotin--[acetyl-CoA-carboxylase] ligase [Myxococcota bacterium]
MKIVHHLDEAVSTNDVAHDLAARGALDGTVVVAESQQGGRGRHGREWFSPAGGNVYLSYVHRSRLQASQLGGLTLDVATAVATALEDSAGLVASLKWPNDLLVAGRKVAGILTELHTDLSPNGSPVVVVGVGINVSIAPEDFPESLRAIATSVFAET